VLFSLMSASIRDLGETVKPSLDLSGSFGEGLVGLFKGNSWKR
jgi:hypothetical protein